MAEQAVTDRIDEDLGSPGGHAASGAAPRAPARLALAFIVLLNLLVGGGAAGGYLWLSLDGALDKGPGVASQAAGAEPRATSITYDVPDLVVPLNDTENRPREVKISLALEVDNQATVARLDTVMPLVVDSFQVYLREFGAADLDGSAGAERLRAALLMRVNAAIRPAKVRDVRLEDFQVQEAAARHGGGT